MLKLALLEERLIKTSCYRNPQKQDDSTLWKASVNYVKIECIKTRPIIAKIALIKRVYAQCAASRCWIPVNTRKQPNNQIIVRIS